MRYQKESNVLPIREFAGRDLNEIKLMRSIKLLEDLLNHQNDVHKLLHESMGIDATPVKSSPKLRLIK